MGIAAFVALNCIFALLTISYSSLLRFLDNELTSTGLGSSPRITQNSRSWAISNQSFGTSMSPTSVCDGCQYWWGTYFTFASRCCLSQWGCTKSEPIKECYSCLLSIVLLVYWKRIMGSLPVEIVIVREARLCIISECKTPYIYKYKCECICMYLWTDPAGWHQSPVIWGSHLSIPDSPPPKWHSAPATNIRELSCSSDILYMSYQYSC